MGNTQLRNFRAVIWGLRCVVVVAAVWSSDARGDAAGEADLLRHIAAPKVEVPEAREGPARGVWTDPVLEFTPSRLLLTWRIDPTPRQWTAGLCDVRLWQAVPWAPTRDFTIDHLDGVADVPLVRVRLGHRTFLFPPLWSEGDDSGVDATNATARLSTAGEQLVVTTQGEARWVWSFHEAGNHWRLDAVEWLRFPRATTELRWEEDGTLTGLTLPNDEVVDFRYSTSTGEVHVTAIEFPMGRRVSLERDRVGYVTGVNVYAFNSTGRGQQQIASYQVSRSDEVAGRITGLRDRRLIEHLVSYDSTGHGSSDGAHSITVRSEADQTVRVWRIVPAVAPKKQKPKKSKEAVPRQFDLTLGFAGAAQTPAEVAAILPHLTDALDVEALVGEVAKQAIDRPSRRFVTWQTSPLNVSLLTFANTRGPADAGSIEPRQTLAADVAEEYVERDELGRVTLIRTHDEGENTFPAIAYVYDTEGELVEAKIGKARHFLKWDTWGRLVHHTTSSPGRPSGNTPGSGSGRHGVDSGREASATVWAYGPDGWLDSATSSDGFATELEHNGLGLVTSITHPRERPLSFRYSRFGDLESYTNPEGDTIRARFDRTGQLVRRDGPGQLRESFKYHPGGAVAEVQRTEPGQSQVTREFDVLGRMTAETMRGVGRTTYEYNELGQVVRVVHPNGRDVVKTYDELGRVTKIRGTFQRPVDIRYDDMGRPTMVPVDK